MKFRQLFTLLLFVFLQIEIKAQTYTQSDTAEITSLIKKANVIYYLKDQARYSVALDYSLKAAKIAEALEDKENQYLCYTVLAKIYGSLNKPLLQQKYILKASRLNIYYTDSKKREIEKLQQELDEQNKILNVKETQLTKLKDENEDQKINLEKKEKDIEKE